ncbi:MAG: sugar isomerase [Candidatus Hydrogenedentes bacterium]|nr:sugar isomerase [Candidatus Hydrogenedentota bacterium]
MCCQCINRREFMGASASLAVGAAGLIHVALAEAQPSYFSTAEWDPAKPFLSIGKALRVQPVLMYRLPTRKEMSSWKSWGGVQTEAAANEEAQRIAKELEDLAKRAPFPMTIQPVIHVTSPEEASASAAKESDATIIYPATGSGAMLTACVPDRGAIVFVRHKSGPVYYWYEALSTKYLKTANDCESADKKLCVEDVVVDDPDELLWRLRALYAVANFKGTRIVALGGAMGKYAGDAPKIAREKYGFDIVEVSYDDLGKRIESAMADPVAMQRAEEWTQQYLKLPGTTLETERPFVVNSFVLYGLFKQIMQEHETSFFTIKDCMGTIMPMSKTTACLTLQLLNDEGYGAFCESDFVVVPTGVFLRHLTGQPVFMHNSTFPHNAMVTCAHCTGPRRMNGDRYEPARIVTHYESEFGAAPKVEMPIGQELSFVNPEYTTGRWVGIRGTVESNPYYDICRSQQDVRVHGEWKKLLNEVRDSHWMMVYGDHLDAIGYAAPRIGISWDNISGDARMA